MLPIAASVTAGSPCCDADTNIEIAFLPSLNIFLVSDFALWGMIALTTFISFSLSFGLLKGIVVLQQSPIAILMRAPLKRRRSNITARFSVYFSMKSILLYFFWSL